MKFRITSIIVLAAVFLAGCSLASDITPPPGYVPPTPLPTLGALFPASAPNLQNGKAIFTQNCVPCHGDTGLGNGPQSQQLPVTVPALGLADTARSASPAQWFTTVSQGNLDRFMPPWAGALPNDQDRWDVVYYALSLHTTPDQIAQGKALFDANCPNCASKFTDLKKMAALSEDDIIRVIKNGDADIPAFGKSFSDEQALDVAMYIRTLIYAATPPTAAATSTTIPATLTPTANGTASSPSTTETSAATASGSTPAATTTNATATIASTNAPGTGAIHGNVQISDGSSPAGLGVILHGFDHPQDQTSTPQEVLTLTTTVAADGTFQFNNVAMPANRIFTAEVDYKDVQYQSDSSTVTTGMTNLVISPVKLYETTNDISTLTFQQIHLDFDFATSGQAQVYEIYAFNNTTDKTVIVSTDGATVPFIKIPDGAQNVNYLADPNSSTFVGAGKNGVAAPPNSKPYAIIASFSMPYNNQLEIKQQVTVDSPSMVLLLPDGMNASGSQLTDNGIQTIQNNSFRTYSAANLKAGDVVDFVITGTPKTSATTPITNSPAALFIGAGVLGLILIGLGVWFFFRDQKNAQAEEDDEDEFESADDVMDAILALDDLHRAGKIKDEVYQKRREELKEILKEMS